MYYEDFKAMLKKKDASYATVDLSIEKLRKRAESFLGSISLRRYIGRITVDSLLEETMIAANPLSPIEVDIDKVEKDCEKANQVMRDKYGVISESFNGIYPAIKELVAWCAIFPEKLEEFENSAFPEDKEDEEDFGFYGSSRAFSIVFVPGNGFGCSMGDELPLPKAISALSAAMFCKLMEDESEDYEERERLGRLLVPAME